mgnify:CR=1 FL=1
MASHSHSGGPTAFRQNHPTAMTTPRLRETGTPRIPAHRSRRSLWNTALLDTEQISFLLLPECEHKLSDITMNNIGTATLHHPQLLYASSRTTRSSGITLAAEQQRPWWTPLHRNSGWNNYPISHERKPRQESNQIRHDLQTGMTCEFSTLNVLASSQ